MFPESSISVVNSCTRSYVCWVVLAVYKRKGAWGTESALDTKVKAEEDQKPKKIITVSKKRVNNKKEIPEKNKTITCCKAKGLNKDRLNKGARG